MYNYRKNKKYERFPRDFKIFSHHQERKQGEKRYRRNAPASRTSLHSTGCRRAVGEKKHSGCLRNVHCEFVLELTIHQYLKLLDNSYYILQHSSCGPTNIQKNVETVKNVSLKLQKTYRTKQM